MMFWKVKEGLGKIKKIKKDLGLKETTLVDINLGELRRFHKNK